MPACETPEVVVCDRLLTLQLNLDRLFETREERQLKQVCQGVGSVTLAPAGFRFWGKWDKDVEILNQQRLIELERENVVIALEHPDLISANFHRSLDGTRTANYGQWRSLDNFNVEYAGVS